MAASASGKAVKLFFTYWALEHMRTDASDKMRLDGEAREHRDILEKNWKGGHLSKIPKLISETKALGENSMLVRTPWDF